MYYNFEELYNIKTPHAMRSLYEFIDDVFESLKEKKIILEKTTIKHTEYGFYLKSIDASQKIFCGLWMDIWETKGVPFCISLIDYPAGLLRIKKKELEEVVLKENEQRLSFIEYEECPTVLFNKTNNHTQEPILISKLIIGICQHLKFGING